ncbi:sclB protein [Vibrio ishigakensis]|uniref:SclB protein n=1 Tax=Vibrio ishigakensis TaxID=1481914 RepID=A0A0B8PHH6_9VIBR|nr:sclB protein [Vibrio ishigakensis]
MVLATTSFANNINQQDTVQDREGNTYRTVKIGEQIWMAENLRSTHFQDGSVISSAAIPKDDEANLLKYGRLYNWMM